MLVCYWVVKHFPGVAECSSAQRETEALSVVVPKGLADSEGEICSFFLAVPLTGIPGS